MNLKMDEKNELLKSALHWCSEQKDDTCRWVLKLQEKYPGDPGILSPLYLNTLCLHPGEALYLPAGELHAYLQGFGVELMANSDNVLRGGLTVKYMDLNELEKNLIFEAADSACIQPQPQKDGTFVYKTPSREFELVSLNSSGEITTLDAAYPVAILVVIEGTFTIKDKDDSLVLKSGESCFLPCSLETRTITGRGKAFIARTPAG
jgi:mannose-6-phosphate isomerase